MYMYKINQVSVKMSLNNVNNKSAYLYFYY